MLRLVALLIILPLHHLVAAPPRPPKPDFKTEVDYVAWMKKCVVAGDKEEANAAPLYFELVGDPVAMKFKRLPFKGLRNQAPPSTVIGPWDPHKHDEWEEAYENTSRLVQQFQLAAQKPYFWWDLSKSRSTEPKLWWLQRHSGLSWAWIVSPVNGASEHAWRAPGGKLDEKRFESTVETLLGAAGQVERQPTMACLLGGVAVRQVVYGDLRAAAQLGSLSKPARRHILDLLRKNNPVLREVGYWACGEEAMAYDAVQFIAIHGKRQFAYDEETLTLKFRGALLAEPEKARDAMASYFDGLFEELAKPLDSKWVKRLEALDARFESDKLANAVLVPGLSFECALWFKMEAARRSTHLIYELLVFADLHGKWPATLNELSTDGEKMTQIDPFSGNEFVYRLKNGEPLIYSVGENGRDDGGEHHDPEWRSADFILWPPQP